MPSSKPAPKRLSPTKPKIVSTTSTTSPGLARGATMLSQRNEPKKASKIHVYVNGNQYHPGRRFVLTPGRVLDFERLLANITTGLRPSFGAVHRLYTLEGKRIASLAELSSDKKYVAAAAEKFRALNYTGITDERTRADTMVKRDPLTNPLTKQRIVKSGKARKIEQWAPKTIKVMKNGDAFNSGIKLFLNRRNAMSFDQVLQLISDRLSMEGGAVRKLFSVTGQRVTELEQIEANEAYVAVSTGSFKKMAYAPEEIGYATKSGTKLLPPPQGKKKTRGTEAHQMSRESTLIIGGEDLSAAERAEIEAAAGQM